MTIALVTVVVTALIVISVLSVIVWKSRKRLQILDARGKELRQEQQAGEAFLQRIGACLNTTLDLEPALEIVAEHIIQETKASSGAIFLLDAMGESLQAKIVVGSFPPIQETEASFATDSRYLAILLKSRPIQLGEGLIGFVAQTGETVFISDARNDPRVPSAKNPVLQIDTLMIAPLQLQRRILGVVAVANKDKESKEKLFSERDFDLLRLLADQAALTVYVVKLYEQLSERKLIEKELQVAQEFQKMLLPHESPKAEGFDIAAFNRPALEIGGDYYDFFWLDPDHIGIAIVDVAGKGIPGALVMATIRSTLRAEAVGDLSPKEVLKRVNLRMLEDTQESIFITMIYAILDVRSRRMRFVRAGHEPLVSWNPQNEKPHVYEPEGIAVGMVNDNIFSVLEECEIKLASGDTIVMFTDGVVEVMNSQEQQYGLNRFLSKVQENHANTARAKIDNIISDINDFAGGVPHQDDITMVAIRVKQN